MPILSTINKGSSIKTTAAGRSALSKLRKADRAMETTANGTYFQEGDRVRIKRTGEQGRINATAGGVAYVLMDETHESRLFAAYIDEDAIIELVTPEAEETILW
jgi:hypothetical protein